MSLTQMVNTRRGGGVDLPACIRRRRAIANPEPEMNPHMNPPPAGTDAVVVAQMQLSQQMADTMTKMQAQPIKTGNSHHLHHHQHHLGISITNS
jgi:hypothetical protein